MALAQRVVFNPLAICTGILSQSLVPWLSQSGHPEAEASLVKVSSAASAGVLGCVILFYPWLGGIFLFVFGENWRLAGIYAGILLLFIPMRLLFDLLVVALVVRNRQGVVFLFRVFTLISGLATLQLLSDAETIALIVTYSIVQATVAVIGILIALRALGTPPPAIFTSMVICMGAAYCGASNELLLASILGAQSLSVLFLLLGSTVLYISVASLRKTYKANHA